MTDALSGPAATAVAPVVTPTVATAATALARAKEAEANAGTALETAKAAVARTEDDLRKALAIEGAALRQVAEAAGLDALALLRELEQTTTREGENIAATVETAATRERSALTLWLKAHWHALAVGLIAACAAIAVGRLA